MSVLSYESCFPRYGRPCPPSAVGGAFRDGILIKGSDYRETLSEVKTAVFDETGCDWHECHKPGAIVHVCADGEYMGHVVIFDEVKPGAGEAIARLTAAGVTKTVMLTGDIKAAGDAVGREPGMDEIHTGLLPDGKAAVLMLGALGPAGMWIAVFADAGVMVIAVLNAMRALGSVKKQTRSQGEDKGGERPRHDHQRPVLFPVFS